MKIDVERMELEVLAGARESHGYRLFRQAMNMFAIHPTDPSLDQVAVLQGRSR
jgi:hypothetical protein